MCRDALLRADTRSRQEEPRVGVSWQRTGRARGSPRRASRSDGAGGWTLGALSPVLLLRFVCLLEPNWESPAPSQSRDGRESRTVRTHQARAPQGVQSLVGVRPALGPLLWAQVSQGSLLPSHSLACPLHPEFL